MPIWAAAGVVRMSMEPSATAPMPNSSCPGAPILRATNTSSGAPSAEAICAATGTPPRGSASTTTGGGSCARTKRRASSRPAWLRSWKTRPALEDLLMAVPYPPWLLVMQSDLFHLGRACVPYNSKNCRHGLDRCLSTGCAQYVDLVPLQHPDAAGPRGDDDVGPCQRGGRRRPAAHQHGSQQGFRDTRDPGRPSDTRCCAGAAWPAAHRDVDRDDRSVRDPVECTDREVVQHGAVDVNRVAQAQRREQAGDTQGGGHRVSDRTA